MAIFEGQVFFESLGYTSTDNYIWQGIVNLHPNYQNLLSIFQSYFGLNARQDIDKIYINKADLPSLIPGANNTTESLLCGLLLQIQKYESTSEKSLINITRLPRQFIKNKSVNLAKDTLIIDLYVKPQYQYGISIIEPSYPLSPNNF